MEPSIYLSLELNAMDPRVKPGFTTGKTDYECWSNTWTV